MMSDNKGTERKIGALDSLTKMGEEVAEWCIAKGWANDGRTFGDECALLHSEISEALEAFREFGFADFNDEKGKPQGIASECADLLIRLLDTCSRHDIDLSEQFRRKMDYNWTRTHRHGGKAL